MRCLGDLLGTTQNRLTASLFDFAKVSLSSHKTKYPKEKTNRSKHKHTKKKTLKLLSKAKFILSIKKLLDSKVMKNTCVKL